MLLVFCEDGSGLKETCLIFCFPIDVLHQNSTAFVQGNQLCPWCNAEGSAKAKVSPLPALCCCGAALSPCGDDALSTWLEHACVGALFQDAFTVLNSAEGALLTLLQCMAELYQ